MVSHVPYPAAPKVGIRTWAGRFGILLLLFTLWGAAYVPRYFFFPMAIAFIGFGLLRAVFYASLERPAAGPMSEEFAGTDVLEDRPAGWPRFRNPLRRPHHQPVHREEH